MSNATPTPTPDATVAAWELPTLTEQPVRQVRVVLGRADVSHAEWEKDTSAAIALDRRLDAPVEIEADGELIAWGEVLVLDGRLAVRITKVRTQREEAA